MMSSPHSNRSAGLPAVILAATATRLGNWSAGSALNQLATWAPMSAWPAGGGDVLLVGERAHVQAAVAAHPAWGTIDS
jgi:hypothetical protein